MRVHAYGDGPSLRFEGEMGESDYAVMETALEAARGKASAAASGLYCDPYAAFFDDSSSSSNSRLCPLFLRGNFARAAIIEKLITSFLGGGDHNPWPCHVISLGAGRDSVFFRLLSSRKYWPKDAPSTAGWFEVDLPAVAEAKVSIIKKSRPIEELIGAPSVPSSNLWSWPSVHYHVIGSDLRQPVSLLKALGAVGATGDVPTFILAECVLCYLEKDALSDLLFTMRDSFPCSAILSYEALFPLNDNFAHVMAENLRSMGCSMPGAVEGLKELKLRFKCAGWIHSHALDMLQAYEELLDKNVREKSEAKVVLDELEEWCLVMRHYAVCLATAGGAESRFSDQLLATFR